MPANAIFGLLGCGLLSLAAVATLIRLRRLPVRARHAVMLAAALAVFVPIGDLSVAAYVRGVTGDLSMATLVLAGAACLAQLTGRTPIERRERRRSAGEELAEPPHGVLVRNVAVGIGRVEQDRPLEPHAPLLLASRSGGARCYVQPPEG